MSPVAAVTMIVRLSARMLEESLSRDGASVGCSTGPPVPAESSGPWRLSPAPFPWTGLSLIATHPPMSFAFEPISGYQHARLAAQQDAPPHVTSDLSDNRRSISNLHRHCRLALQFAFHG